MEVVYLRSFLKDIKKIKDKNLKAQIKSILKAIEKADKLESLPNIKKLKGYSTVFRVRIGAYRLGVFKNAEVVEIARFLKRNDIYKVFPK
jgi:mRNA interferase RelE/StbE